MAGNDDTDRLLSAGEQEALQPPVPMGAGVLSVRTLSSRLSADGRYLTLTFEQTIDLQILNRLRREDMYLRQAGYICDLYARYTDRQQRQQLSNLLYGMLSEGKIEWLVDSQGHASVNVLKGSGQSEFIRLILSHATNQKKAAMGEKETFNDLKHLLHDTLRHQGNPISINSLSTTLRRAVKKL